MNSSPSHVRLLVMVLIAWCALSAAPVVANSPALPAAFFVIALGLVAAITLRFSTLAGLAMAVLGTALFAVSMVADPATVGTRAGIQGVASALSHFEALLPALVAAVSLVGAAVCGSLASWEIDGRPGAISTRKPAEQPSAVDEADRLEGRASVVHASPAPRPPRGAATAAVMGAGEPDAPASERRAAEESAAAKEAAAAAEARPAEQPVSLEHLPAGEEAVPAGKFEEEPATVEGPPAGEEPGRVEDRTLVGAPQPVGTPEEERAGFQEGHVPEGQAGEHEVQEAQLREQGSPEGPVAEEAPRVAAGAPAREQAGSGEHAPAAAAPGPVLEDVAPAGAEGGAAAGNHRPADEHPGPETGRTPTAEQEPASEEERVTVPAEPPASTRGGLAPHEHGRESEEGVTAPSEDGRLSTAAEAAREPDDLPASGGELQPQENTQREAEQKNGGTEGEGYRLETARPDGRPRRRPDDIARRLPRRKR